MSIAVSALVKPSCIVRSLTVLMCCMTLCIGVYIATLSASPLAQPWRVAMGLACMSAAVLSAAGILRNRGSIHIDISGTGQIRIHAGPDPTLHYARRNGSMLDNAGVMKLLPSSTLWACLLMLRLESEQGRIHTIFILPDTTPQTSFRALAVACHWIAAHNIRAAGENA